jgi:putative oxidoreductase
MTSASDRAWAILIARTILGIVFFVAGIYKTFMWGPLEHARVLFVGPYAQTFLPVWSLWATGSVIPIVELIAGGLVFVGLWTRPALLALAGVLVLVTFGHLLVQPATSIIPFIMTRSSLLLIVLLAPATADRYSLDQLLRRDKPEPAATLV